jgi:hypothetical protein
MFFRCFTLIYYRAVLFREVIICFLIVDSTVCLGFLFCSPVVSWCGASSCVVRSEFIFLDLSVFI